MTGMEIALLLIGVMFLVGSFLVSERLSSSDIEAMKKLSEKEISIILEKEFRRAQIQLSQDVDTRLEDALDAFERQTDKEINRKILSIGEYTDGVKADIDKALEAMGKSHNEIVFMYDRLNDKQDNLTQMTRDLQAMESAVRLLDDSISDKIQQLNQEKEILSRISLPKETPTAQARETMEEVLEQKILEDLPEQDSNQEKENSDTKNVGEERSPENLNQQILSLHQLGYSEIEIAKQLGRGLGEVKLVLGLFK